MANFNLRYLAKRGREAARGIGACLLGVGLLWSTPIFFGRSGRSGPRGMLRGVEQVSL